MNTRDMQLKLAQLFLVFVFVSVTESAYSQGQDDINSRPTGFEIGAHMGNLLPNQIDGVSEIMGQWGLRVGWGTGSSGAIELGAITGKEMGQEWTNAHISLRMSVPIETLTGFMLVGGDVTHYESVSVEQKTFGGGHLGGGVMAHISDDFWFRTDMKFNINPGTSLYFGFGFLFRFPPSGSGPGN